MQSKYKIEKFDQHTYVYKKNKKNACIEKSLKQLITQYWISRPRSSSVFTVDPGFAAHLISIQVSMFLLSTSNYQSTKLENLTKDSRLFRYVHWFSTLTKQISSNAETILTSNTFGFSSLKMPIKLVWPEPTSISSSYNLLIFSRSSFI